MFAIHRRNFHNSESKDSAELIAIIEKPITTSKIMGGNSLGHGHSFVSDNRTIRKYLSKAGDLAKKNPEHLKPITELIVNALNHDEKIQQNLILHVEKLVEKEDYKTACIFANCAVRSISTKSKKEAIFVGLSLPYLAIDEKLYRVLINLTSKLGYIDAARNLVACLDGKNNDGKLIKSLDSIKNNKSSRLSYVFEKLSLKHLERKTGKKENQDPNERSSVKFPPVEVAIIAWQHRQLLRGMVARDLKMKYHKSILGYVWALIEPLAMTFTFLLIHEILRSPAEPYRPLSIMIGILHYSFFAMTFKRGTQFLESNVRLIQKVSLPKEVFLLSNVGFTFMTLLLNTLALIPLMIYYELMPTYRLLLVPVAIFCITILVLGLSMFTSILHAKLRDMGQIVNVFTKVAFYFTPVFYSLDMIIDSRIPAEYFHAYLIANPLAVYLSIIRTSILDTTFPISTDYVIIALVETFVIYILGSYYYHRKKDQAVKYL